MTHEGSAVRRLRVARKVWQKFGMAESVLIARDFIARKILRRSRWIARPSLNDLWSDSTAVFKDPREFIESLVGEVMDEDWRLLCKEFDELTATLSERYRAGTLAYGTDWAIETDSALVLYVAARRLRPKIVLETGVANGHSTYYLLAALEANQRGQLHSVDISNEVGSLLMEDEKRRWTLHVISSRDTRSGFERVVYSVGDIGYFLHDSDHNYRHQRRELGKVLTHIQNDAFIACDDADSSFAFLDLCSTIGASPRFLTGRQKVLGATRLGR